MLSGMSSRGPNPERSAFHAGELAVQEATGVRDRAAKLGSMFRSELADAYRVFFERLPFVLAGSIDSHGQVWASMLLGAPGFVRSPDPETLVVFARPNAADPLAAAIREGAPIGVLGIELEARRRARVNGHIGEVGARGFSIHVDQSYGNCPKYITPREPIRDEQLASATAPRSESNQLSDEAVACIAQADTCFIATASAAQPNASDSREGVDVSHRGGERGFVRADRRETGTRLWLPDYAGNNAFNTLGNLARYPHAGLLFPNFESGDVLLLTCETRLHFASDQPPTERAVELAVRNGWYFQGFMPFRWHSCRF
jgi:uncharacterized protein